MFLMNKNQIVAKFHDAGVLAENYVFDEISGKLPIGMNEINEWLENRKASKHNASIRKIMEECGCGTTSGFIQVTHAASLNDTFWVKTENETLKWEDVSLYQNEFNEIISKLAFEGVGLQDFQFSDTSPELSTEGSFKKCWKKESDGIFLYKRGSEGARNAGLEPYCEALASEIALQLCPGCVPYHLVKLHGKLATKCQLFTNETYGYVPMAKIPLENKTLDTVLQYFSSIGSEDTFRRMLVLDALTFNVDRHLGNYGILIHNDTLEPIKMAPVFDLNMAMLPYVEEDEFTKIGTKLLEYGPRIGDDFTRVGQLAVTSEIRKDLISLKDFEFSFQGDLNFSKKRVKWLEELIHKQAAALLFKETLYTKDVFIPDMEPEKPKPEKKDVSEQETYLEKIKASIEKSLMGTCFINEKEDGNLELEIIPKQVPELTFCVDGKTKELNVKENDEELAFGTFLLKYESLHDFSKKLTQIIDQMETGKLEKEEIER